MLRTILIVTFLVVCLAAFAVELIFFDIWDPPYAYVVGAPALLIFLGLYGDRLTDRR